MEESYGDPEIEAALSEYRRDGTLIREKSRLMVETWLDKIYPRMVSQDTSAATLIEIGKVLIELGDLKPKKEVATGPTGPAFSITIQLPDAHGGKPVTITGVPAPVTAEYSEVEEVETDDILAELDKPAEVNFNLPSFSLNSDLYSGSSMPEGD